jgi:hypothetical protein
MIFLTNGKIINAAEIVSVFPVELKRNPDGLFGEHTGVWRISFKNGEFHEISGVEKKEIEGGLKCKN